MAYGGLTGPQESARRDMQWAMSGPEDRARMLGYDPYATDTVGRDEVQNIPLDQIDFDIDLIARRN